MNKVTILGRLGQDPETKQINENASVTKFSIATSEKWKDKSGEMQERTEWHRCSAWNKTGEIIEKYFSKGDPILVEGKIETNSYEKEGEKRYITQIKVNNFEFVPQKKSAGGQEKTGGSNFAGFDEEEKPRSRASDFPDVPNMAPTFDQDEEMPF